MERIRPNNEIALRIHCGNLGGVHVFNSRPSPELVANDQLRSQLGSQLIDWQSFHNFLLQRMTKQTTIDRLRYARKYASVLEDRSASILAHLLQLPPHKRIHIQKSLSALARFTGRTEQWRQIRQQYQLSWSTGTEKIDAFTRLFDDNRSLDCWNGCKGP